MPDELIRTIFGAAAIEARRQLRGCRGRAVEGGGVLGVEAEQTGVVAATGAGCGAGGQLCGGPDRSFVAKPDVETADPGQAPQLGRGGQV